MSITAKQAYLCDSCKKVFWTTRGANNCAARHAKAAAEAAAITKERKIKEDKRHELRNSVSSFEEVADALVALAEEQGYTLTCKIFGKISSCSVSHSRPLDFDRADTYLGKDRRDYNRRLAFCGRIVGTFASETKNGHSYFSDWLRSAAVGIHTGTGSGGGNFQYSLTMWVADFSKIKEAYSFAFPYDAGIAQHNALYEQERLRHREKHRLNIEYEQNYLPLKLSADPDWLFYDCEAKDLRAQAEALIEKSNEMNERAKTRMLELDDERAAETTPSSDFDYDEELLLKFDALYGSKVRMW
jgi:hypothetical protein